MKVNVKQKILHILTIAVREIIHACSHVFKFLNF